MRTHRCMFVTAVFEPQLMMYFDWLNASGSVPCREPIVAVYPATPAVAQIVRSSNEAPSR